MGLPPPPKKNTLRPVTILSCVISSFYAILHRSLSLPNLEVMISSNDRKLNSNMRRPGLLKLSVYSDFKYDVHRIRNTKICTLFFYT